MQSRLTAHVIPLLGSSSPLHEHLSIGISIKSDASLGHVHPDGDIIPLHLHVFAYTDSSSSSLQFRSSGYNLSAMH
jgi:hypothetical protein